jgi:hypothetical protein
MRTKAILTEYFKGITDVASQGDAREENFYLCLEALLQKFATSTGRREVHVTTLPKRTEENLDYVESTNQLKRYRKTFPNLILTNFFEFLLYRDGQLVDRVLAARPFHSRTRSTSCIQKQRGR